MTVAGKGGRPKAFNSPEELEQGIVDYFIWVDNINKERKESGDKIKPYTLSGICVYLDIAKDTFWEYAKKDMYSESIKRAKSRVENYVEEGLLNGSINAIGGIFNLKNNFGWVDKIDVNTTTSSDQLSNDDIKAKINELKKERKSTDTTES